MNDTGKGDAPGPGEGGPQEQDGRFGEGHTLIYQQLKAMDYILGRKRDLARFLTILWQFGRLDLSSGRHFIEVQRPVAALWSLRQLMDKLVAIGLILDGRFHFKAEHNLDRVGPELRALLTRLHGSFESCVEIAACADELETLYEQSGRRIEALAGEPVWRPFGEAPPDEGGPR